MEQQARTDSAKDPLEALYERALIEHGNTLSGRQAVRTPKEWDTNYRQSFTHEANWALVAQVQLVHVEGKVHTLVGLFDELQHLTVRGCRRLIAAHGKIEGLPQKSEEVTGDHWLPYNTMALKRQTTEKCLHVCCDLTLNLGQHLNAAAVALEARLVGGGLQRLSLLSATTFEGNSPRTILVLPEGLDVLEGLTHTCKEAVWRNVGEEMRHE